LQASTGSQITTSQPFAALLDATAPIAVMPAVTNAPATPPPPAQPAPANAPPVSTGNFEPSAADAGGSDHDASPWPNPGSNTSSGTTMPAPNSTGNPSAGGNTNGSPAAALIVTDGLLTGPSNVGATGSTPSPNGGGKVPTNGAKGTGQTPNKNPDPSVVPDAVDSTIPIPQGNSTPSVTTGVADNGSGPSHPPPSAPPPGASDGTQDLAASDTAPILVALPSDTQAPPSTSPTPPENGHDNKADGNGSPTDTSVAPPPVSPPQPVAAVIVLNVAATPAPAAPQANVAAAPAAIGESAKGRGRAGLPIDAGQDEPQGQDATSGAPAPQSSTAGTDGGGANPAPASPGDAANAGPPSPGPAQIADDTTTPAPSEDIAINGIGHTNTPAVGFSPLVSSGAGTSSGQGGTGVGHTTADGLPNFGFAVATPTAPSAPGAVSATASTASVPIAGLAVAIAARAQAGSNQFDIRLDPPELGRIDVRLDVDRDGQVTTHVAADRADTLALLQSQQPQLEQALEQAGLKTADNGLQFTLRDQSFTGQNNNGGGSPPNVARLVIPDTSLAPVDATQIYARSGLGGGLDIRV
jgi:flagellar hook-length control protein FliK